MAGQAGGFLPRLRRATRIDAVSVIVCTHNDRDHANRTVEELSAAYNKMSPEDSAFWHDVTAESRQSELSMSIASAIESAKSLPWKYDAVVRLPFTTSFAPYIGLGASYRAGEITRLNDDVRRRFDAIKDFTVPFGEERNLDVIDSWLGDGYYLTVKFDGYI